MRSPARGLVLLGLAVSSVVVAAPRAQVAQAVDTPIPDEGTPAERVTADPLVGRRTQILQAGVVGVNKTNDGFTDMDVSVLAFAEHDGVIYVGGKFTAVKSSAGSQVGQRFLAAFDINTGAWIESFRPVIDGNVWDLKVTADGRLIVAGQFRSVNGVANTAGVAMLDPVTGAVDPNWRVNLVVTGTTRWALGRTLDIEGDLLYIGGNFTRITGSNGVTSSAGQVARVNVNTGNVDGRFLPNLDGIVFDVDATADIVYVVGNFFNANGVFRVGQAPFSASNGALVPNQAAPVRTASNITRNYQQATLSMGSEVWMTGSEHSTHVYRASDYGLLRGFVSMPYGDGQALAESNGIVYKGSHANGNTFEYADTVVYPNVTGYTSRKPIKWVGAWDATIGGSHDHLDWVPGIGTRYGEGGWELFIDSSDCLWAGGDFNRGSYDGNVPRFAEGFARFCGTDTNPPEPPSNPTATLRNNGSIDLAWTGSIDDRAGQVRYEVLKNDRILASYIGVTSFRDTTGTATDRYFVRAVDLTGNKSASTQVFTASGTDTTRPTTPADLIGTVEANGDVTLTWSASFDAIGVTGYVVDRNGVEIARTTGATTAVIPAPAEGTHYYQVRAFDAAGNESYKTPSTVVTILPDPDNDTTAPTTPQDLAAVVEDNGDVTLTWTPSTDNIAVAGYVVTANGVEIDRTAASTITVPKPAAGEWAYQVRAFDDAGNESARTPSTIVEISLDPADDTVAPTTPRDLAATVEANGDVTLTWTASTDNLGVQGYAVFRNGVEIQRVTGTTATIAAPAVGDHWYQVLAFDEGGNESFRSPSTLVTIDLDPADDTTAPSTPRDLAGVVEANGDVTLTWTASTDNIAVTEYVVFRNGVEIQRVTGITATIAAPAAGDHWYQVRAVDAAGNESFKTPSTKITIEPDPADDVTSPSTPRDLAGVVEANGDVTLTWTASTDNIAVTEYVVYRNSVEIQRVTGITATIAAPAAGDHWYQVRAVDAAGNESFRTPSTKITIVPAPADDVTPPKTPQGLAGVVEANGDVTLTWTAPTDNVAVTGYIVFRNGVEIQRVTVPTATVLAPATGSHFYQVRAFDAAGNEGNKTPSVRIDIP